MNRPQDSIRAAFDKLQNPVGHIMLTGDAGTGKSTLVRDFISKNEGEVIVLAPTGIAAVNIGGMTIHRFCHFPPRPISYNSVKWLDPQDPFDSAKRKIIKRAKWLIIDEISMVRADMMDQIAWFFQKNFPGDPPFAGLKLILVGDLGQLPPVLGTDEEKQMIQARYKSEFFFSAKCWQENTFEVVRLTHIFRQSDPEFVRILNNIRNNSLSPLDLDKLNNTCLNEGLLKVEDGIMLCSTNSLANECNSEMIYRLQGTPFRLEGHVHGDFNPKSCPVEPIIDLKFGCRLMTMRNDPNNQFFNGTIGTLVDRDEHSGELIIKLDWGGVIRVSQFTFESVEYKYDELADKIKHAVTGTFLQYPVKVAYAMTIHKSQGATFEKVIIDLGENGAFAHGQTYVALSRCTSLQGVILRRKLKHADFIYNEKVKEFNLHGLQNTNPAEAPDMSFRMGFDLDDDLPF